MPEISLGETIHDAVHVGVRQNVRLSRGERLRRAGKRLALEALLAGGCYAAWTAAFPPG